MPQIYANDLIKENPFFELSNYSFEKLLNRYTNKNTKYSKYIVVKPVYKNLELETIDFDPVAFFSNTLIKNLKLGKISLIFDCSIEGSHIAFPYFDRFSKGFSNNNIPLQRFYYLTGDAAEKDMHLKSNVYHINACDTMLNYTVPRSETTATSYFTCLSRKPRYWRSRLIYEMHNTAYKDKMLASHPKINSKNDFMNHDGFDVDDDVVDFFIKNSPLQVSKDAPLSDTMSFNDGISTLPEVYNRAVFDVAMETYQERDHEYITEKTFKPMLNMMPVIIWGTPGINTSALQRLGFNTYEDWFDLTFDTEPDTEKRLRLLLDEIHRVCNILDGIDDISSWQRKNMSVIEHNKNLILNLLPTNVFEFTRLYNDIEAG
jgi:hypothetical protein